MRFVAIDTETHLIRPGLLAPPLVCATFYEDGPGASIRHVREGAAHFALDHIADPDVVTIWQNGPFDWAVLVQAARDREHALRIVFNALEAGRMRDTRMRGKLLDIHDGVRRGGKSPYSLAAMAERCLGIKVEKGDDTWRMRYAELEDVPLSRWPAAALGYAQLDAELTWKVWASQGESSAKRYYEDTDHPGALVDEVRQLRAAWAVHLMSAWGVRTDGDALAELRGSLESEIAEHQLVLKPPGYLRSDDTMNMKLIRAAVAGDFAARGVHHPTTDTGLVSTDRETLGLCTAPELRRLSELTHARKVLGTFVEALDKGIHAPINAGINPLVDTGRMSCRAPNLQNLPRKKGVRQCFIPRPGWVYSSCDYPILELRTLAQVTKDLGIPGRLLMTLQGGIDPHSHFGAQLAGQTYEDLLADLDSEDPATKRAAKDWRQLAKVANFGFPGGLGADAFVSYAAGLGVVVDAGKARGLKEAWQRAYPELRRYFAMIGAIIPSEGRGTIKQVRSNRVRGGVWYTAACNGFFQSLAADLFKEACWLVVRESYLDRSSDLYGSRVVIPVHDELVTEHPEEVAGPAAQRIARLMEQAAATWTPDVPCVVKPALMRRWDKDAEPVHDEDGKLVPWDAVEAA